MSIIDGCLHSKRELTRGHPPKLTLPDQEQIPFSGWVYVLLLHRRIFMSGWKGTSLKSWPLSKRSINGDAFQNSLCSSEGSGRQHTFSFACCHQFSFSQPRDHEAGSTSAEGERKALQTKPVQNYAMSPLTCNFYASLYQLSVLSLCRTTMPIIPLESALMRMNGPREQPPTNLVSSCHTSYPYNGRQNPRICKWHLTLGNAQLFLLVKP